MVICAVDECKIEYGQKSISFYGFPFRRPEILKEWINVLQIQNGKPNWTPHKWTKICSNHFLPSDFQERVAEFVYKFKILKPDAVPSVFRNPLISPKRIITVQDEGTRKNMLDHIGDHLNKNKVDSKRLFVSDPHFEESCFNREADTTVQDGTIEVTERQRLDMKENAVATIFPMEQVPAKYMDMDSVCRVCLTEQTLLISMYEINFTHNLNPKGTIESVPLSDVLQKYCNVTIDVSDKKPQKICVSCTNAMHKAYYSFELFLQSNATLEKLIQSQNVKVPKSHKQILPKKPTNNSNELNVSPGSNKTLVQKSNRKKPVNASSVAHAESITENDVDKNGEYDIIDLRNVGGEVNASSNSKTIDFVKIEEGYSQKLDKEVALIMDSSLQNDEIITVVVKKEKKTCRIKTPPYFLNDPTGALRDHSYLMSEKYLKDLKRKRIRQRKIKVPKPVKPRKTPEDYRTRQKQLNQQMFESDIFKCRFCKITLNGIDNVLQHVKDKHADSKRCILCPSIVKKYMMYHVAAHSKNGLVCRICRLYFEDKESFLSHKTEFDHNDMLTCPICGKRFKNMKNRRSHSIVHKDANKVGRQCSYCGKVVKYAANLARHERSHLEMNERKTFLCQNCGISYTTKWALESHVKCAHEGQNEVREKKSRYYKFYKLKRQGTAPKPRKRVNVDKKPPAPAKERNCEYCPKTFTNKSHYMTHILSHPECKNIRCAHCPLILDSVRSYRLHQEVEHRTFKCEVCKKGFAQNYLLKGHMNMHTVRFKCEFCDGVFTSMLGLKTHQRIHTGERPYCCEHCGKSFKQLSQLTSHMHCMHTQKNHKCTICDKTFNFRYGLEAHIRSHTGERPFACLYCDKRFRDTVSRHKHVKRYHPENWEEFIEYKKSFQWEESKEVRINSEDV